MKEKLKESYKHHLEVSLAKRPDHASDYDRYQALALAIRDLLVNKWINTSITYEEKNPRTVYYISLEYLIGRTLGNSMINVTLNGYEKKVLECEDIRETGN